MRLGFMVGLFIGFSDLLIESFKGLRQVALPITSGTGYRDCEKKNRKMGTFTLNPEGKAPALP